MKAVSTIGRIMYSLPILVFGMMHLMMGGKMAGMVPAFIPDGVLWVYVTGVALVVAGISIMIGKMAKMAGLGLAMLLLIFVMTIHIPMVMSGNDAMMQMGMSNMLKDLALAGGALVLAGIFWEKK